MTRIAFLLMVFCLAAPVALADTYRGTYTDTSGVYVSPSASNVLKNGTAWTAANLVFSNASTAVSGDRPGAVLVTLSNVTSTGDYTVFAKDASNIWHTLEVRHKTPPGFANISTALDNISNKTDKMPNVWPY